MFFLFLDLSRWRSLPAQRGGEAAPQSVPGPLFWRLFQAIRHVRRRARGKKWSPGLGSSGSGCLSTTRSVQLKNSYSVIISACLPRTSSSFLFLYREFPSYRTAPISLICGPTPELLFVNDWGQKGQTVRRFDWRVTLINRLLAARNFTKPSETQDGTLCSSSCSGTLWVLLISGEWRSVCGHDCTPESSS